MVLHRDQCLNSYLSYSTSMILINLLYIKLYTLLSRRYIQIGFTVINLYGKRQKGPLPTSFSSVTSANVAIIFFVSRFSFTDTDDRAAEEGKGPSFISLYHFHPLTNIQTVICTFAWKMTISYF